MLLRGTEETSFKVGGSLRDAWVLHLHLLTFEREAEVHNI